MTNTTRELIQRMAKELDHYRQLLMDDRRETHALANEARAYLAQPEPEGPPLEPRGCPTPGACSCPTSPTVPPELIRVLELAEAALADIGDAERETGDDLAWAETRAAQDLPRIRAALARWGRPELEVPTDEEILNLALEHNISYSLIDGSVMRGDALLFARAALARWGRPEPEGSTDKRLIHRLLLLAEQAVKEALDFEYGDPEDRHIWRELQELKQLAEKVA